MKFRKQIFVESMVGLFSFSVLVALFMLTVVLSRDALFRSSQPVDITFEDVMGLRVGDVVSARGVTIGKVKQITLQPDGVHVHALLDTPLSLREDYRIEVMSTSVLGGRYVNIDEGTHSAALLPPTAMLRGVPSTDLIDAATQTVTDIREALNDGVLEDLAATMAQIRKVATRLGEGEGLLGSLIADDAMQGDLGEILANIRRISAGLSRGEGTLGRLLNDESVYADLEAVAANLRQVTDGVAQGEGALGRLLASDDPIGEDLAETLASIRRIAAAIASGEGTIGRLVSDEELYLEFKALVREGRAAVDDLRETSPITTFTSIFFGVF